MKDDEERSIIFEGETPHEGLQGQWVADPEPERRCCVRYGLIIINATLVAAAAVLITVGMIAKRSSISRLCPQCRDVSEAAAVIGIIFLITSTLGFFALLKRHVGVLVTYVVVTSLLMFGIVGITLAGIILAASGVNLSHEWKEHVTENSDLICSVQNTYTCSGWDACCGYAPGEVTPVPAAPNGLKTNTTCVWDPVYCLSKCGLSNHELDSCESSVQKWLRTLLVPFILGMLVVVVLIMSGGYRSIQLRRTVRSSSVIHS